MKQKKLISLLAAASLSIMGQLVQAGQEIQATSLFKFPEPTVAPASGITPQFTNPPIENRDYDGPIRTGGGIGVILKVCGSLVY